VSREDCTGSIKLFGEDEAGEVVSEGDRAEGEQKAGLGSFDCGGTPTVCGADGEGDVLDSLIAAGAQPGGEFGGGELAAAAVEEHREDGFAA